MTLSACIWPVEGSEKSVLERIDEAGFQSIDVRPDALRALQLKSRVQELGLRVTCIGASAGVPDGVSLDDEDTRAAKRAADALNEALQHGADLGAQAAYLVPGKDGSEETVSRYVVALRTAAERAQELGLKLCIEHFSGTIIPTVQSTLDFLDGVGHPNLYLLLDIGHVQMSKEDPVGVIRAAGDRLGYVHLDDNDGEGDLHLALLDGVLTRSVLSETFGALDEIGYDGPLSLELSPNLPDPMNALKSSRAIVMSLTDG